MQKSYIFLFAIQCYRQISMNDIAVFTNLSEGQRVRFTRLSKGLRQLDLASMAKVNLADITAIEKDRYLRKTRKERILRALGLLDNDNEGN